jgi:uncharacterized membrane protein YuzA (DUF378 family)
MVAVAQMGPTATWRENKETQYQFAFLYKICLILLIVGALNWFLVGAFKINLVEKIFGGGLVGRLIYLVVGAAAVYVMFDRNTYLPFLGPMVAPCGALQDRVPPGANASVVVTVKPKAKVLFWAAEQGDAGLKEAVDWQKAYGEYENTGVATADEQGKVELKVRRPQGYRVPMRGMLKNHIHYRECGVSGWMGPIETVFLPPPLVEASEPYNGVDEQFTDLLEGSVPFGHTEGFMGGKSQSAGPMMAADVVDFAANFIPIAGL